MIQCKFCLRLKLDPTTKWYMHKSEFVIENEMHKILLNSDIQTEQLIPTRSSDLTLINSPHPPKNPNCLVDFVVSVDQRVKIEESEKRDTYLDLARELKKLLNKWVKVILVIVTAFEIVLKVLEKTVDSRIQRTNQDHPDYCIEIAKNTQEYLLL